MKILKLVLLEYIVYLQTLLIIPNAPRAFLILTATSLSVNPLSLLIILPK